MLGGAPPIAGGAGVGDRDGQPVSVIDISRTGESDVRTLFMVHLALRTAAPQMSEKRAAAR
jgi:hypothetical protein